MADFLTAHKITMQIEGGYANDPDDTGGETYKGVSRKNFSTWQGWFIIDSFKKHPSFPSILDQSQNLQDLVLKFYKQNFWDVNRLDDIADQKVANEMYDTGVNMGVGIAALFLQEAINLNGGSVTEDRQIGPATIQAANAVKRQNELFKTLNILQGARYVEIIKNNPKQVKFWRSWLSRVSL